VFLIWQKKKQIVAVNMDNAFDYNYKALLVTALMIVVMQKSGNRFYTTLE